MLLASNFLHEVLRLVGTPYLWGGKTPQGLDCSGLVTYALWRAGGPDWRQTHGSANLREACAKPEGPPRPGALAFYPRHVMVHVGLGVVVGACGGDSRTTNLAIAERKGARVMSKATHVYRPDFLGWGDLPGLAYDAPWRG